MVFILHLFLNVCVGVSISNEPGTVFSGILWSDTGVGLYFGSRFDSRLFSLRCSLNNSYFCLRPASASRVPLYIFCRQFDLSVASITQLWWLILHDLRVSLRDSLYLNFGDPLFLNPAASSPKRAIFGSLWSAILETCPAQRSWIFCSMAWMDRQLVFFRTSLFVT